MGIDHRDLPHAVRDQLGCAIPTKPPRAARGAGAKSKAKAAKCAEARAAQKPAAFTLPYPPLLNHAYMPTKSGGRYMTADGKRFKRTAGMTARAAGCREFVGPVSVTLAVFRPRKAGDIDGTLKLTLDSLNGIAYADDKQVRRLVVDLDDDKDNARVEVVVSPIPAPPQTLQDVIDEKVARGEARYGGRGSFTPAELREHDEQRRAASSGAA